MKGTNSEPVHHVRHPSSKIWQVLWICCFLPLAWLNLLMFPVYPIVPELDMSWAGALPYFAQRSLHFGTDIIFTFGPLGHFVSFAYTGSLTTERTLWELIVKGLIAGLFGWAMCELQLVIRVVLGVCIILFLGNFEEAYAFAIVLSGLMLLQSEERGFWVPVLLGLFLATLALIKFIYFIEVTCAVGLASAYYVVRRRWISLASLVGSFTVGFIVFWVLAGQNPKDIPVYITNSVTITSGYNAAMFMPIVKISVIRIALFGMCLIAIQLTLFCLDAQDKARAVFGSLFLMLMLFFLWKHAFTRWLNHAPKFFSLFVVLALASWLLKDKTTPSSRKAITITCLSVLAALVGMEKLQRGRISNAFSHSSAQIDSARNIVSDYSRFDELRRAMLAEKERTFSLPRIKDAVANQTLDVLGYRQGIALLNGLNYAPRPIFQGYSAYTNSLIEINQQHYQSVNRPGFVISKLETIDDRFPTLDDSGVLLELLYHYRPTLKESGWQLWKAVYPINTVQKQFMTEFDAKIGEDITLPDAPIVWAQFTIDPTIRGKIAEAFFKSAPVFLQLVGDSGSTVRYRIVPSMAGYGFLLNPEIKSDDDLVAIATGAFLHKYRSMSFAIDPDHQSYFRRQIHVRLWSLPSPEHRVGNQAELQKNIASDRSVQDGMFLATSRWNMISSNR